MHTIRTSDRHIQHLLPKTCSRHLLRRRRERHSENFYETLPGPTETPTFTNDTKLERTASKILTTIPLKLADGVIINAEPDNEPVPSAPPSIRSPIDSLPQSPNESPPPLDSPLLSQLSCNSIQSCPPGTGNSRIKQLIRELESDHNLLARLLRNPDVFREILTEADISNQDSILDILTKRHSELLVEDDDNNEEGVSFMSRVS